MRALLARARNWCLGFFEQNAPQSAVRLCAILLTLVTGCAVWMGRDAATVAALVGGGVVALLVRKKAD